MEEDVILLMWHFESVVMLNFQIFIGFVCYTF